MRFEKEVHYATFRRGRQSFRWKQSFGGLQRKIRWQCEELPALQYAV